MRVTEGMNYLSLLRDINLAQEQVQTARNEVSSGKKRTAPSDDPIAAYDVVRLNAEKNEAAKPELEVAPKEGK